jgi:hypothetical protein
MMTNNRAYFLSRKTSPTRIKLLLLLFFCPFIPLIFLQFPSFLQQEFGPCLVCCTFFLPFIPAIDISRPLLPPFLPFLLLPPPSFQCPAMAAAICGLLFRAKPIPPSKHFPHLRFSPPLQSFSTHLATKMWRFLFLAIFLLLFPSKPSLVPISSQGIVGGGHPEPKVWICEGHIGQQQFFQNAQEILPYEGI